MNPKKNFYKFMALVVVVLLGTAIGKSMAWDRAKNIERLKSVETISYEECVKRYDALLKKFQSPPRTGREYYANLGDAYALGESVQKAMQNPPPTWTDHTRRNFNVDDRVRSIPVELQPNISQYSESSRPIQDTQEFRDAGAEFDRSKRNPLLRPDVYVPGGMLVVYWWLAFQFGLTLLIAVHFCIRLHEQEQSIILGLGSPEFWLYALVWEIGLFRYPKKISPAEQIRRLKRWGALVFTSVLPCMAGAGSKCEEKPQPAKQYQLYKGLWSRFSFTTNTDSDYLGLDGAVFFKGRVQQSTATFSLPCGLFIGVFYSEPLNDRNIHPNYGRELDPYLGWKRTFGKYTFDASFTYLDVSPLTQIPRGDVIQLSERLTRKVSLGSKNTLLPYVWLRQAMPVRGPTPVGGNFIHVGTTLSHDFRDRVSAAVTAEVVRDSGAFGYREGYIGRLIGGANWKLDHGVSLQVPQITFTDPASHTGDGRHEELSVGVGISFSPRH